MIDTDHELEARLQTAAEQWRAESRSHPAMPRVATDVTPLASRRHTTSRVVPGLAAAAVVAALAAGSLLVTHRLTQSQTGAPSTDPVVVSPGGLPVRDDGAPSDGSTDAYTPPSTPVTCTAADFRAGPTLTVDRVRQGVLLRSVLRYAGSDPCVASGAATTAEVLAADGSVLSSGRDRQDDSNYKTRLQPGESLIVSAVWSSSCGDRPARIALTPTGLIGGGRFSWPLEGDDPVPACGAQGTAEVTGQGYVTTRSGATDTLTGQISAPTDSPAGKAIPVSVLVTNTTTTAVALSPCPTFFMAIIPLSTPSQEMHPTAPLRRLQLNCASAPAVLRPGQSMTLQQSLPTDALSAGRYLVSWDWNDGILNSTVVTLT